MSCGSPLASWRRDGRGTRARARPDHEVERPRGRRRSARSGTAACVQEVSCGHRFGVAPVVERVQPEEHGQEEQREERQGRPAFSAMRRTTTPQPACVAVWMSTKKRQPSATIRKKSEGDEPGGEEAAAGCAAEPSASKRAPTHEGQHPAPTTGSRRQGCPAGIRDARLGGRRRTSWLTRAPPSRASATPARGPQRRSAPACRSCRTWDPRTRSR